MPKHVGKCLHARLREMCGGDEPPPLKLRDELATGESVCLTLFVVSVSVIFQGSIASCDWPFPFLEENTAAGKADPQTQIERLQSKTLPVRASALRSRERHENRGWKSWVQCQTLISRLRSSSDSGSRSDSHRDKKVAGDEIGE